MYIEDNPTSIVLGIDDLMKVEPSHGFIYKSLNSNTYINGVCDEIASAEKYIIFGCSLGCTDEWYFREIFSQKGKSFEVYYYGDRGKIEILERIKILSDGALNLRNENLKLYDSSNLAELKEKINSDYKIQLQLPVR